MPWSAKRPCAALGCAALVDRGQYCPLHARTKKRAYDNRGRSSAALGYGAAWQRLRRSVLAEEPLCRNCGGRGRVVAATDIDHIIPKSQGGTDDVDNLQPLCHACHTAKTNRERAAYGLQG